MSVAAGGARRRLRSAPYDQDGWLPERQNGVSQWFEWGVGIASWVIVVLFLVQVVVWIMLYRLFRSIMAVVDEYRRRFEPQIAAVQATIGDVQKTLGNVTDTTNKLSTEVRAISASVTASAERITTIATESAEQIRTLVSTSTEQVQTAIQTSTKQVQSVIQTSTEQVQSVVQSSTETARSGIQRVDLAVERTVTRFEESGKYVQESVLAPVREVAAIVAGVKAALETLFGYPDRKQIDQAYQDEELFI